MQKLKLPLKLPLSVASFSLVVFLLSSQFAKSQSCLDLFPVPSTESSTPFAINEIQSATRLTLAEYGARAAAESEHVKVPQFTTPKAEIGAAQTWIGVRGPEILQQMLPDNVVFIDHQLRGSNGDGLVKTNSGNMVHLRGFVKGIGTNFGVSLGALKDNLHRANKSFVREDADAVVMFVHGGGTKTTGHHVAASMMSYLGTRNYDVVSLDMPWHAEGPRVPISHAKESLELMRDFIREFVSPSGKPVIIVGHSMGGMIADMYMRMYPNDKLVTAVVPMSTVADAMPEGTIPQKLKRDAEIGLQNLKNPNIPEAERDLGEWLARQNKLSPTCGMFCQVLMYSIDWARPTHGGKDFLPALYLIGEADGLYQGYQQSFATGVSSLQNARLKVISKRRDIKDKTGATMIPIGHLIFDHKPMVEFSDQLPEDVKASILNGTFKKAEWDALKKKKAVDVDTVTYQRMKFEELKSDGLVRVEKGVEFDDLGTPETFVLLRNFIAEVIGQPAKKVQQEVTPLEAVTQAWANNLVFRQFAKSYVYQYLRSTPAGAKLGKELEAVTQRTTSVARALSADPTNVALKSEKQDLERRREELTAILKTKGKIEPAKKHDYDSLKNEYDNFNATTLSSLNNQRKTLRQELVDLKSTISTNEKFVMAQVKQFSSPRLKQLNEATERAFGVMMRQDSKVRELTDAFLSAGQSGSGKSASMDQLPDSVVREFEKFERFSELYQRLLTRLNQEIIDQTQSNAISAVDSNNPELIEQIVLKAQQIKQSSERLKLVLADLEKTDQDFAKATTRVFQLEIAMAQLVGKEFFVAEYYTVEQLLSGTVNLTPEQISSLLQKIWSDWVKLWSTRIADSSDSLY
jgi:pimeloyl-ACP methyl ester carboxylesterase